MALLFAALVFGVLEWFFEFRKNRLGIYLTKPTMMLLLMAWVWFYGDVPELLGGATTSRILWFILGLVFCLGGDVFLMLPENFFLPGLILFLLGHIFYIAGFNHLLPPAGGVAAGLLIAGLLAILAGWIYLQLARGMLQTGKTRMRIPVLIYTIVITLMLFSALMTLFDPAWNLLPAALASVGATLFLVSDIMNAWVRFVGPIKNHRLWIMSTYHLAQVGIAASAVFHFAALAS